MKPIETSRPEQVFGGDMNKNQNRPTKWNKVQSEWFYNGLPEGTQLVAVEGVDAAQAIGHLKAIQCSFEPKHEHKSAGVAYLMSLWFSDIITPEA
jgi:hypothetical protein